MHHSNAPAPYHTQPQPHTGAARALRWALASLLCWLGSPVALILGLSAKRAYSDQHEHRFRQYLSTCSDGT